MIRNLKVLGLALGALLVFGAMMASAASASTQGEFTSTGPVEVTGEGEETFTFQVLPSLQTVTCHAHHSIGLPNETPHGLFNPGAGVTTLTDTPTYTACTAHIGETAAPATVTTNGCDFLLHIGVTTGGVTGTYGGSADVVCPGTNQIEVHAYSSSTHATTICTIKVPAQNGISGGHVTHNANGTVTVSGTFTGIKASRTGILCGGNKETLESTQQANSTASGKNSAGEPTDITVTDTVV